jgi:hypothetical protein
MGSRSFGSVVGSARRMPATSRDYLFAITVGYLLVPNVVFLASWLTPLWGFPAAVLVLACLIDVWRRAKTSVPPLTARQWVFVAALALVSTAVSGIGELNVQVWDYLKHNLAFHDLVAYRWPVVYPYPNPGGSLLCYYIAYYLPASLAGKLLGLAWTAQASFVWGLVGVLLAFAWVARLGRPRGGVVLAVFMLVDGFAWLPGLYPFAQRLGLLAGTPGGDWWTADRFTERFASFGTPPMRLLFESEPTHLLWSPQHAIAAWLATACVLRTLEEGEPPRYLGLVFAATLLWSPLVVIGLAPFVLMSLLRDRGGVVTWPAVAGGVALAVPVGLYFLAHSSYQYFGLLPARFSGPLDWVRYLLFLVTSAGILVIAVALVRRRFGVPDQRDWALFVTAAVWLVGTTLVVLGYYNDWVMRVSMPALMVFHLVVARVLVELWRRFRRPAQRLALATVLLLSAERPLKVLVLAPIGKVGGQPLTTTIATATRAAPTLVELPGTADFHLGSQYVGSPESWFGRHMMHKHAPDEGPVLMEGPAGTTRFKQPKEFP